MRRWMSAMPAAAVLGLALLTSTVRAQEPKALPMDKPVAPVDTPVVQPLPAPAMPAMIAPGSPCAPCGSPCDAAAEKSKKKLFGNLMGCSSGKCANPCNPVPLGCSSGCSERAFIFGSCKKFFDCHAGCGPIPPQAVPVGNCYYGTFHRY